MNIEEFDRRVKEVVSSPRLITRIIRDFVRATGGSKGFIESMGWFIRIKRGFNKLVVVGDLHGDYVTLKKIVEREGILLCERESVVAVFLGDYIDRGYMQVETITAIYMLKTMYPGNIVVLRGNHEPPPTLIPYPHDFTDTLWRIYGSQYLSLYRVFLSSFQKIPMMALLEGEALFLHGGPTRRVLNSRSFDEAFVLQAPQPDDVVVEDILWSDPAPEYDGIAPSYRGAGILYGRKAIDKTLELANVKTIIRAHEPVPLGFRSSYDGRVLTVFSSRVYGLYSIAYMAISSDGIDLDNITSYVRYIRCA